MSKYQQFIFKGYNFSPGSKTVQFNYSLDDSLSFTETYKFDFEFAPDIDQKLLELSLTSLFYMAGVSYFKTYLPPKIILNQDHPLDDKGAGFFCRTYQAGLGEFFYVNDLDPHTPVNFPPNSSKIETANSGGHEGLLIGIGGGKDSLVSVELLRDQPKVATWSVGHRLQLEPLVERIGLPHFWVERIWDPKLLELNNQDALNGHVPISAILSCVGTVVAVLTGYRDVVVSNESSANELTLNYQGVNINHQYSKSLLFEKDFQNYLSHLWNDAIRYYSFLRPLSELRIAETFANNWFDKYKDVFSSCNKAFTHASNHLFWDGKCPKCAFVFLALTPFVSRQQLEGLFSGKNLLLDPDLEPTYRQLLGIEGDKPLDCVGEVKESRAAMRLAQKIYPELKKYEFELPADYDYRMLSDHSMPEEIARLLLKSN